ncbi:MAG: hypothetical protein ACLUN0_02095 [Roseburia sp.]
MGRNRKKRCLAFLMALTMMTGLFMGDAAGLLVKAEDTPASVQIGSTTLETGWYVKAVDSPSIPGPAARYRGVDKVEEEPESGGYIYFDKDTATMTIYNDMEIATAGPSSGDSNRRKLNNFRSRKFYCRRNSLLLHFC